MEIRGLLFFIGLLFSSSGKEKGCTVDLLSKNKVNIECSKAYFKLGKKVLCMIRGDDFVLESFGTNIQFVRAFNYFDVASGQQKLFLFDSHKEKLFISDWYDTRTQGDKTDYNSINFSNNTFKATTEEQELKSIYIVKFHLYDCKNHR